MKKLFYLLSLLSVLGLVACDKSSEPTTTAPATDQTTAAAAEDAIDHAGDTLADWGHDSVNWMNDSWKDITASTDATQEEASAKLSEAADYLNKKSEEASAAIAKLSGDAKTQGEAALKQLKEAQKSIADSASKVAASTDQDWSAMKAKVSEDWKKATDSLKKISGTSGN